MEGGGLSHPPLDQLAIIESVQVRGPVCRDLIRKAGDLTWPTYLFFPECHARRIRDTSTPVSDKKPKLINLSSRLASPWRKVSRSVLDLQDPPGPSRTRGQDQSPRSSIFNIWGFFIASFSLLSNLACDANAFNSLGMFVFSTCMMRFSVAVKPRDRAAASLEAPRHTDTSSYWWINPRRRILQFWNHFALSWLSTRLQRARRQGGRELNIKCRRGGGVPPCQTRCKLNNSRIHLKTWHTCVICKTLTVRENWRELEELSQWFLKISSHLSVCIGVSFK